MKSRSKILIAFLLLAFAGFSSQIYIQNRSIRSDNEVSDITIERQLQVMLDNYEWSCPPSGNICHLHHEFFIQKIVAADKTQHLNLKIIQLL